MTGTDPAGTDPAGTDPAAGNLAAVPTTALATVLDSGGYRNQVIRGVGPIGGSRAVVGPAFTARLVPGRPGLAQRLGAGDFRALLERVPAGHVLVVDGLADPCAALIGDLMAMRLLAGGVEGLVTDGAVRDVRGLAELDLAVYAAGLTPAPRGSRFELAGVAEPIACGGVAVLPGDVVVGDVDGVVVLPGEHAERLLAEAREQDRFEEWVALRVRAGEPMEGLHPPDAAHRAEYQRWRDR